MQLHNLRIGQASTNFQQPIISKWSYMNKLHHLQHQQSCITANQNEVTDRITKPCEKDNKIGKMLCQLVNEQSPPIIGTDLNSREAKGLFFF